MATPDPTTSTEERLLGLLTDALARQETATRDMARELAGKLEAVGRKLDRVLLGALLVVALFGLAGLALLLDRGFSAGGFGVEVKTAAVP